MNKLQYRDASTEDWEDTVKTMLVPLDGSPLSETVLPLVIALARGGEYRVTLLSVWEAPPRRPEDMGEERIRELCTYGMKRFRAYLANVAEAVSKEGIDVTTEVRSGHPGAEVQAAIAEMEPDVIAMASKGRGGVTDKVVTASQAPVLVLGPRLLEVWPPRQVHASCTLVFLEGSAQSEPTLPAAMDLAREAGTSLPAMPEWVLRKKVEELIDLAIAACPGCQWARFKIGGRR